MILNWDMLQELLIVAIACSTVTVAFIQKTKKFCKKKSWITGYSFLVNMVLGFLFSKTFTSLENIPCLWVGFFSFIGADTIYRNLEGKLTTYTELRGAKKKDADMNQKQSETKTKNENTDIIGVIPRD